MTKWIERKMRKIADHAIAANEEDKRYSKSFERLTAGEHYEMESGEASRRIRALEKEIAMLHEHLGVSVRYSPEKVELVKAALTPQKRRSARQNAS